MMESLGFEYPHQRLQLPLEKSADSVLIDAFYLAYETNHDVISPAHIFMALAEDPTIEKLFADYRIDGDYVASLASFAQGNGRVPVTLRDIRLGGPTRSVFDTVRQMTQNIPQPRSVGVTDLLYGVLMNGGTHLTNAMEYGLRTRLRQAHFLNRLRNP